jgi:hypothetical protein
VSDEPKNGPQPKTGGRHSAAPAKSSSPAIEGSNAVGVLKSAIKAVPAVKYALGVAGVVAATSIAAGIAKGDARVAVLGTLIMFFFMFLLVLFARATKLQGPHLRRPILLLFWTVVVLTCVCLGALVASWVFQWPRPIEQMFGSSRVESEHTTRVYLRRLADDTCAELPPTAKLLLTIGKATTTWPIVNRCESAISWRGHPQASFDLKGGGDFVLAEPDHVYWLDPGQVIDLHATLSKEPRVKVLLLPYRSADVASANRGVLLRAMLEEKLTRLADQLEQVDPTSAAKRLKLVAAEGADSMSNEERDQRWHSEHLLEISSGLMFGREGVIFAKSDLFLGDLTTPPSFSVEMKVEPEEFERTNDSQALAVVIALARDAERLGEPSHVVTAYLNQVTNLCQQLKETGEDVRVLKNSAADLVARWDPTARSLCR